LGERITTSLGEDGIARIEMQDEVGRNALSYGFVEDLLKAVHRASEWNSLKVLVLLGLPEVFSSGASREVLESLASGKAQPSYLLLTRALLDMPAPTIAAMEGHAMGGGLALGVSADLVVIARESRYGCPFMNMGFTPGMGLTRLLEHVLSPAIAHEMMFTGEAFKGSHFIGCSGFNYVLPRAEVRSKAFNLADRIAEKPRVALVALKQTLAVRKRQAFEAAHASEAMMHQVTFAQDDIHEQIVEQFVG
jgi:polyketide biosynthesis enoyl-CoA hydratase PksI